MSPVAVAVVPVVLATVLAIGAVVAVRRVGDRPAPPLPAATVATYVAAAGMLAQRYVDDAWCAPLLSGSLGTRPSWPQRLATRAGAPTLVAGPPEGRLPTAPGTVRLDVSDARAVLPRPGRSWTVRPRFCVAQLAHPRLVTSGGTTHPSYKALPRRLDTIDQIFRRFPAYLGRVVRVGVPVTVEVAYRLAVGSGVPEDYHLWWITTLDFVPAVRSHTPGSAGAPGALRLATWDVGGRGAWVTVRRDAAPGPVVVRPSPPGSGP
jgi:hypothetical protein